MSDNDDLQSNTPELAAADEADDLTQALADLADFVKPLAREEKIGIDLFYYLLLLWAAFHVYPLDPPPDSTGEGGAKIIPVEGGFPIFDYGDCLSVSPGEDYGSYCTGRLIISAQAMIDLLAERGVVKVGFLGHDIARRAAWMECVDQNIEILNYEPSEFDKAVRYRVMEARKQAEKVRRKIPLSSAQRPEME